MIPAGPALLYSRKTPPYPERHSGAASLFSRTIAIIPPAAFFSAVLRRCMVRSG